MKLVTVLIGGAFALALFFLYKRTKQVQQDAQAPVGSASDWKAFGDIVGGLISPPSATDKLPVGPPRIDTSDANKIHVLFPTPIQYVPPAPPTNSVQITPAFNVPSFLQNFAGGATNANQPTKPPGSVLTSAIGIVNAMSGVKPPTNSGVSSLSLSKNSGLNTTALKSVTLPKTSILRKL